MALTTDQLKAIDNHLRKENWLITDDLIAELTDHYANGIDERMAVGESFESAMRDIHTAFGGRKGLLKMEEDYVAQAYRAPYLAFWNRLKTYAIWPKALVPALLVTLLIQLSAHSSWLSALYWIIGASYYFRSVFVVYFFFRLQAWGKQSRRPIVKNIFYHNGFAVWYWLFQSHLSSASVGWQCFFIGIWSLEFICAMDLLASEPAFRKQFRFH